MKNFIKLDKKLNVIQKLAILGFLFGYDNYGEDVIDVLDNLEYNEIQNGYSITIILRESPNHNSTSGVGFYVKDGEVEVYCSGSVLTVGLTSEMKMIFKSVKDKK